MRLVPGASCFGLLFGEVLDLAMFGDIGRALLPVSPNAIKDQTGIAERKTLKQSSMPEGLEATLSPVEFFDVVGTKAFWRPQEISPRGQGYHWNTNAETYHRIGEAMGEAMKRLLAPK